MEKTDTICALATPPGTGGIGVIRLSGPEAFTVADQITQRRHDTPCATYIGHTLHRAEVRSENAEIIDDVLLAIFHAPRSYTGEDVVEISAHGGPVPLRQILARLLQCGTRLARPGEFTQRAFLNGKMDLAQAEAVGDLIAAQTDEALRLAHRQSQGRLSQAVGQAREVVLGVLAQIEASIDFPEDVGELDFIACQAELDKADRRVSHLLATADRGILLREGLSVALVGRPNVGKSSLMNSLLRTPRAIVTPIPGTTRDTIEETLNLRGMPVRLVDTAGLRETDDLVEQMGVARTRESIAAADLVILVLDAAVGELPEDAVLRASLSDRPFFAVWNKWDLRPAQTAPDAGIPISAVTGWNIEALEDALVKSILHGNAVPLDSQSAVVSHARHRQALESARIHLAEAQETIKSNLPADFLSIDVRSVLTALGEITGETASEDVISEIFSRFCIGK